jgi:ABC-2 type transport system ATP-binding protein
MIDIQQLSFGYSSKQLIYQNLNLNLEAGRIFGLLGKNGAGKSTLLRNIAGLLYPTKGSILVDGIEPRKRSVDFLQGVYFLSEEVYVPALFISKFVDLNAAFYPNFDKDEFYQHLKEFEIIHDQRLNQMSFGQQKKVMIAFGLACRTKLMIMDEPTNGLDIPSKSQFRKIMALALTDDRLFIISTHQVRDLDSLIDEVIIIENNEVILKESISKISEKLVFKNVSEVELDRVLYAEDSLNGKNVVMQNTDNEDSKVNLEHLFNVSVTKPKEIKQIFNSHS